MERAIEKFLPGFDVQGTKERIGTLLGRLDPGLVPTEGPIQDHPLLKHLGDHGGGLPHLAACRKCALLQAHFRLALFDEQLGRCGEWVQMANAATRCLKSLRQARKQLQDGWEVFEPVAQAIHRHAEQWPQVATLAPHDHDVVCAAVPDALAAITAQIERLQPVVAIHEGLLDSQLRQPLGKKPTEHLLLETESVLCEGRFTDGQVAALTQEGAEAGRVQRLRVRRAAALKERARKVKEGR